jgi:hypothetical protein
MKNKIKKNMKKSSKVQMKKGEEFLDDKINPFFVKPLLHISHWKGFFPV